MRVPPGPIVEADFSTTYTTTEFKSLLIYASTTILNFDTTIPSPPAPAVVIPPLNLKALSIYDLGIADAELTDRLPILDVDSYYQGRICPQQGPETGFRSFHFENGVRTFNQKGCD